MRFDRFYLPPATYTFALAITFFLCSMPKLAAAMPAQQGDEHDAQHDGNRDGDIANNPRFQEGWRQGQEDRSNHRDRQYRQHPGNDYDRHAYEAGYDQGYQSFRGDRGGDDRDGRDHDRHGYDNPGYRMGFQDGMNDGRGDRSLGHRFKYGKGYKHPDRGYVSSYGDRGAYMQQYRDAYEKAYRQGYSGHEEDHR